jgi:polyferredoxin
MTKEGSAAGGRGVGSLEVLSGPDAGRVVTLGSVTAIGRPPEKEVHRINLLRNERLRTVLRHPALSLSLLWITTVFVLFVAAITAYGGLQAPSHPLQQKNLNPGMWLTWHVWFAVFPLSALLIGRLWCAVCPIAFIGDLVVKVARLNVPVPKIVKRLDFWLLLATFVVVDSTEGLTGVADSPLATAVFLVLIIGAAVFFTFLFERRTFCRYVCPLSGWLGTYATLSVFEVRGNKRVCQTRCGDYSCYRAPGVSPAAPCSCIRPR